MCINLLTEQDKLSRYNFVISLLRVSFNFY